MARSGGRWLALALALGCAQGEGAPAGDAAKLDVGLPDANALVDAPPSDAPAAPCTWESLLANGSFDLGHAAWTEMPVDGVLTNTPPLTPQSDGWDAWFARATNGANQTLLQTVAVPQTVMRLRLQGYYCFVRTSEAPNGGDRVDVQLRGSGGAVLETLHTWTDNDCQLSCGWVALSLEAQSAHAGEMIQLYLHATTDAARPLTSFHFDTFDLQAYMCP